MSIKVELFPLMGACLDGHTVRLGDTKADVERALGRPLGRMESAVRISEEELSALLGGSEEDLPAGPHWFYHKNELRVDFDPQGRVEFIELLGGPEGTLQPILDGLELFQAPPEAVYDLLKEKNHGPMELGINCYCCVFLNLELGVYRDSVPEDVTELIWEAKDKGHPLTPEQIDCENDRTRWAAVGLGTKGYYTA